MQATDLKLATILQSIPPLSDQSLFRGRLANQPVAKAWGQSCILLTDLGLQMG